MVDTGEYRLTRDEAYQAFYLLAKVGSKTVRGITLTILALVGAALTAMYALNPLRLEYEIMAILCAVTFVAVVVTPSWKARRGAKLVAQTGGFYRLGFGQDFVETPDGERIGLALDRLAKAFETPELFVLRPSRVMTLCVPKRLLKHDQISLLNHILSEKRINFIKINEKESEYKT